MIERQILVECVNDKYVAESFIRQAIRNRLGVNFNVRHVGGKDKILNLYGLLTEPVGNQHKEAAVRRRGA